MGQSEDFVTSRLENDSFYQMLFEHSYEGLMLSAPNGRIFEVNPAACRILGYSREEILALGRDGLLDADDPNLAKLLDQRLKQGYASGEVTFIGKGGVRIPAEISSSIFYTKKGEARTSLLFRDISERKRIETALKESEERYRSLVNGLSEGVTLHDLDGTVLASNPSARHILGLSAENIVGDNPKSTDWQAIHEDGTPFPGDTHPVMESLRTGKPCTNVIMGIHQPEVPLRWLSVNTQPLFQPDGLTLRGVITSFSDITERKQVEKALRRSEELYRTIARHLPGTAILLFDRDLQFIMAEGHTLEQNGFSKESVEGKTLFEVLQPEDVQRLLPYYQAALAGIENTFEDYYDDQVYLVRAVPIKDEHGQVFGGMLVSEDITSLKRAEQVLAAEKERLSVTLRSIGDGVITTDLNGQITMLNRVAEKLTDWTQAEAIGQPLAKVFQIVAEDTRLPQPNPVQQVLNSGNVVELKNHTTLISRKGSERSIADTCAPIFDANNSLVGTVLVFRDVTEEKKLAEEMLRVSKLESLSILAGGIAHDFNNLLTGIIGFLDLTKHYISTEPMVNADILQGFLGEVEKATLRTKDLTLQLLTFAKGGTPIKKLSNLAQVVRDSANFALHGTSVKPVFDLPENLWAVEVDSGQLSQVIQNLILNAVQAMSEGGQISIKAENSTLVQGAVPPLPPGNYLKLGVKDQGTGIPNENLAKIFDPYFTTKSTGYGLGLAICYSIIKRHDGLITVESEVGKGTTFYIYLPAAKATTKSKDSPNVVSSTSVKTKSKKKILVMDDDPLLQRVSRRILGQMGHEVVIAGEGLEALSLYQASFEAGQPFDLVFLDLTIQGGMGGKQTIAKLLEFDPQVKAVVCSGYSSDPVMSSYQEFGFKEVLLKPYRLKDLEKIIDQIG